MGVGGGGLGWVFRLWRKSVCFHLLVYSFRLRVNTEACMCACVSLVKKKETLLSISTHPSITENVRPTSVVDALVNYDSRCSLGSKSFHQLLSTANDESHVIELFPTCLPAINDTARAGNVSTERKTWHQRAGPFNWSRVCEVAESVALSSARRTGGCCWLHAVPGRNLGKMMNCIAIIWRSTMLAEAKKPPNDCGTGQEWRPRHESPMRQRTAWQGDGKSVRIHSQFICPRLLASGFLGYVIWS